MRKSFSTTMDYQRPYSISRKWSRLDRLLQNMGNIIDRPDNIDYSQLCNKRQLGWRTVGLRELRDFFLEIRKNAWSGKGPLSAGCTNRLFPIKGCEQSAIYDIWHACSKLPASPDGFIIPENLWMANGGPITRWSRKKRQGTNRRLRRLLDGQITKTYE